MFSDRRNAWVRPNAIVMMVVMAMLLILVQPVSAGIGTNDNAVASTNDIAFEMSQVGASAGAISPVVTEIGMIWVSIDGVGSNGENGAIIQAEKPAGAVVRKAYLAAASKGFSGYKIPDGGVMIDGAPVTWDLETASSISSWNYWADVTALVQGKIDAAPAGRVDFVITELCSTVVDGEILVVIFDDPAQDHDNTVILYFGAQDVAGDSFAITFANPIDLNDPNLALDFSLGLSYGYQDDDEQFSLIDVNGQRLSSWAGGSDDCADASPSNGALLTVGGLDDSTANPADPYAQPLADTRYDDELYSLLPFVNQGDTQVVIDIINPSMDDNIFFAGVYLHSMRENPIGTPEFPTLLFPVMLIGGLFLVTVVGRKRE
ncbi:hypothetical protein L1S32_09245 [Methanogenium sp. S4BF]|uniref:hypothetical protein n=1 Tax=Methanogenium sp. S4BF TaxID=1789226 RepID=UPI0024165A3B|nr:hypothetical protein [Methanogenium sp. S4BF]WFN34026.1 hypothetical protein L1S32_09245 [Methanogenium sp. S4BF]